ncbi:hypothetical protein ACPB67_09900 [Micromonospora taraxaci]|uniref:hypothetical protein n=1 Tax=Micromonospora taraxaci TaxID=1316803 RepID=UPI003C301A76
MYRLERVGGHLAVLLAQKILCDPAFRAAFGARFAQAEELLTVNTGNVTNALSGGVGGSMVRARDVDGGISFGGRRS